MAKARKRNKGQKAKLADKQAEAAVAIKEKETKVTEQTSKAKATPRKKREDWTEADILAEMQKREKALAKLKSELTVKRNPQLISLKERLDKAQAEANVFPRFIKQRRMKIANLEAELAALKGSGQLWTRGKNGEPGTLKVKRGLLDILKEQKEADALVLKLQAELEAARIEAGVDAPAETETETAETVEAS